MANNSYMPDPEVLGRRRFPDNKGFRKNLAVRATDIESVLQSLVPSNYPKDPSTNLGIWYRSAARESARLNLSIESVNNDKEYVATRIKYLQQILGERLFLNDKVAPANYNDESYRDYLLSIKDAYLRGSHKTDIEALASKFTGLKVNIKELYLEAREPGSSVGVVDGNKMIVEVFIEDILRAGYDINKLKSDLDFFINLTRPAHVLYDTKLIWTEQYNANKIHDIIFGDTGGGCVPVYDYAPFPEPTILAQTIFILPDSSGATGLIDSIHPLENIFFFDNSTRVITIPGPDGTRIYDRSGHRVSFSALEIGQYVRVTYQVVPGAFQFWYYPPFLTNYYSQFYPSVYRLPAFQEFVKKVMDAQGRFPLQVRTTPTTLCDRWVQDTLQPLYEDLRRPCYAGKDSGGTYTSELRERMGYPRFSWPFSYGSITDPALLGSNYLVNLPRTPVTDGSGNPASVPDVSVSLDGTVFFNALTAVDASSGRVQLTDSTAYWNTFYGHVPYPGDEFTFGYHYLDGSNYDASYRAVFGIGHWQMPNAPLISHDGTLATPGDVRLMVDGTAVTGAITGIDALVGHVNVQQSGDFWRGSELGRIPRREIEAWDATIVQQGDLFRFDYAWGYGYSYSMLFDDPARGFDTFPGTSSNYWAVFDAVSDSTVSSISLPVAETGYRWRAYLLHHSSLLNSPDTLRLNDFQKPATRASIVNRQDALNHFNEVWSPEFLYDKNKVVLNDAYLDNGLDPVLKLGAGTPTFQQTFGYQPHLVNERKLQTIRTHHHPLIYGNLLLREFPQDGLPSSPICDGAAPHFKVGMKETIPPISECPEWIIFDSLESETVTVSIPGETRGVPNLRIQDKKLRENFILRELEPTGTAIFTYTLATTEASPSSTIFQLPVSFPYDTGSMVVDFPALPVMKDSSSYADPSDVQVTVDGIPWPVASLNPLTGVIELAPFPESKKYEGTITLTAEDIARGRLMLPGVPIDPSNITLTIVGGTAQYYGEDFYVYGRNLSWFGTLLNDLFSAGDKVRVSYDVSPVLSATFVFTYRIRSTETIVAVDPKASRILDNGYVFDGGCFNGFKGEITATLDEYCNFLDDNSDGIKISYFNHATASFEERMFSGPVFETYSASEDEIGVPDSIPDALVRIKGPAGGNPLKVSNDYGFMEDKLVRYRKKIFRELLPDRTFRTIRVTEMLPV